jgi:mannose-6-phosphate isomerase-like protein (cupin superfamily)
MGHDLRTRRLPDEGGDVANYTIVRREQAEDILGDYPGEMRFLTQHLGSEQVAFTFRRMPQHTGGKGSYGHRHRTQEEIYYVASGSLQFKLDDDVVDVNAGTAVRVAPGCVRSVWNDEPEDAELVIVSIKIDDPHGDAEAVPDFWPPE